MLNLVVHIVTTGRYVFNKNNFYRTCMFLLKQNYLQGSYKTHVYNYYYKYTL